MELVHLATDTECGPSILLYHANELVKGFVERSDVRLDADASKLEEDLETNQIANALRPVGRIVVRRACRIEV
jgi:hypothetical protein